MLSLVENSQRKLSEVIKLLYNHAQNLGLQSKIPKSCNFSYFHIGFLHDLGLANAKEFLIPNSHTEGGPEAHRGEAVFADLSATRPSVTEETLGRGQEGPRQGSVLL